MQLTEEEVKGAMEEAWRKFTWKYPTVTSNKFIPRFLAFVWNPKSMKEVYTNAYYSGWLEAIDHYKELCGVIGEDEVRRRRDAMIDEFKQRSARSQPEEKSDPSGWRGSRPRTRNPGDGLHDVDPSK